ncbi:MAG: inorganic diphosphatase [Planctomycetota bacterium]|nr:inorganic diphosphatase [Planctomycetota bacterium]
MCIGSSRHGRWRRESEDRSGSVHVVPVVIEELRGGSGRHRVHLRPRKVEKLSDIPPFWPAFYGYVPGTKNAADGEPCDCLVLGRFRAARGAIVRVRPVALMARRDGDHKILAVFPGDPVFGSARDLPDIPRRELARLRDAFRPYFQLGPWRKVSAAAGFLAACGFRKGVGGPARRRPRG